MFLETLKWCGQDDVFVAFPLHLTDTLLFGHLICMCSSLDRAQEHILPVCVWCYLCHLTLFLDTEADGSTVAGWKKMTRNCVAPAPLPPSLELISLSWVKSATNTWTCDKKLDKISALEKLLPRVTRICYHLAPPWHNSHRMTCDIVAWPSSHLPPAPSKFSCLPHTHSSNERKKIKKTSSKTSQTAGREKS